MRGSIGALLGFVLCILAGNAGATPFYSVRAGHAGLIIDPYSHTQLTFQFRRNETGPAFGKPTLDELIAMLHLWF